MKFAVIVFPGSNCDHDAHYAASNVLGQDAELIWHKDTSLEGADAVILRIEHGGLQSHEHTRTHQSASTLTGPDGEPGAVLEK